MQPGFLEVVVRIVIRSDKSLRHKLARHVEEEQRNKRHPESALLEQHVKQHILCVPRTMVTVTEKYHQACLEKIAASY
jgi:hypothetical protein